MTERQAEAQTLRASGLSFREIGRRMGVTHVTAQALVDPARQRAKSSRWRASGSVAALRDRDHRRAAFTTRQVEWFAQCKQLVLSAKAGGCSRCGENPEDRRKLHFHHRDPSSKLFEVSGFGKGKSKLPRSAAGVEVLLAEIAKCDVLCEGCHREEHKK